MLPLIVFAVCIVFSHYEQDRKEASRRVLETVRSIRLVLDAEMQRITSALQVLSLTNALRDRDFNEFRRISQGFLDQYGDGGGWRNCPRKAGCPSPGCLRVRKKGSAWFPLVLMDRWENGCTTH